MTQSRRVLVIGSGGREHAIAWKLVRDGAEVLVAPGNAEALAVALATTLDLDLAARANLAEIGRQHVLDNYTVDLMISRTLALYADLAGARHGRG
jgi:phosphoribosylamine--glycine ligase